MQICTVKELKATVYDMLLKRCFSLNLKNASIFNVLVFSIIHLAILNFVWAISVKLFSLNILVVLTFL